MSVSSNSDDEETVSTSKKKKKDSRQYDPTKFLQEKRNDSASQGLCHELSPQAGPSHEE